MTQALVALLAATLWLSLVRRSGEVGSGAQRGALAFALAVAVLALSAAWSGVTDRFPRTALAHAVPGGRSFRDAVDRLWNPPPLLPRSPAGVALLDRHMPGERRSLVVLPPDLGIEVLLRSDRASRLPFGDPWEDSFIFSEHIPELRDALAGLAPGDRMLIDRSTLAALAGDLPFSGLAPLQSWVLERVGQRFALLPVGGAEELVVVELAPRRASRAASPPPAQ